jgi:hypothetical protein
LRSPTSLRTVRCGAEPYPSRGVESAWRARDLNEVDRHIADTREHIKLQRKLIQKLKQDGHDADLPLAEELLQTLENSLTILLEGGLTVLGALRRLRATSQLTERTRRRSRGA